MVEAMHKKRAQLSGFIDLPVSTPKSGKRPAGSPLPPPSPCDPLDGAGEALKVGAGVSIENGDRTDPDCLPRNAKRRLEAGGSHGFGLGRGQIPFEGEGEQTDPEISGKNQRFIENLAPFRADLDFCPTRSFLEEETSGSTNGSVKAEGKSEHSDEARTPDLHHVSEPKIFKLVPSTPFTFNEEIRHLKDPESVKAENGSGNGNHSDTLEEVHQSHVFFLRVERRDSNL